MMKKNTLLVCVVTRTYNVFQVIPDVVQLNADPDKNQQPEHGPESHLKVGVLGNYEPYIEPRIGPGQNVCVLKFHNIPSTHGTNCN